ncbi:MAG: HupE/UreJ family protein, partial [Novosphingobium sp.]|nr:HupE/UreJ family protein [Novosphingobium sp.]
VSTLLGLLHGIGFASVLTETGLPQTQLPAALLFFNLGVEAGQIALVIAVLAIVLLVKTYHSRIRAALPAIHAGFAKHASALTLTFIGAVSAFWFIERSVALFG